MGVLDWLATRLPRREAEVSRAGLSDYFDWIAQAWRYGGNLYPTGATGFRTTQDGRPAEPIGNSFLGYVEGLLYQDGPVSAVEQTRLRVFSQAPLLFQRVTDGRPGDLYDDPSLEALRAPWVGGTTSDLQKRALLYADFGGNAWIVSVDDELVVLRPDWVTIVLEPRLHEGFQVGWRQVGITYAEDGSGAPAVFLRGQYAHFAPLPDPLATYRGMSWLTPVIREVMADKAAIDHKLSFLEHAATPNLAISLPQQMTPDQFQEFVEATESQHAGARNSGRTLYTANGADVTVVGANMRQLDFSALLGRAETRIANAAGVHPVIVGFAEGMQGSSLNAGNYVAAKRNFVDTTCRDLWQNWCGSLQPLFPAPAPGDRLWYDGRDIPFLHEDQKDLAEIQRTQSLTVTTYVMQGFTPDSAIAAVRADDLTKLQHTGMVSVQLLPPGQSAAAAEAATPYPTGAEPEPAAPVDDVERSWAWRGWDPTRHPRHGRRAILSGIPVGGRFRYLFGGVAEVAEAIDRWVAGEGETFANPLAPFSERQLRLAARAQGLPHHGSRADVERTILDDVRAKVLGRRQRLRERPQYTYGTGADRPMVFDLESNRRRDVQIRQATNGIITVTSLDDRDRPDRVVTRQRDWASLRRWAAKRRDESLVAWVDKYHPVTSRARANRERRLAGLANRLRRARTFEAAQDTLYDLDPSETLDLYQHLGGSAGGLPRGANGRVNQRDVVEAVLADWPDLRTVGTGDRLEEALASAAAASGVEEPDTDTDQSLLDAALSMDSGADLAIMVGDYDDLERGGAALADREAP